VPYTSSEIDLTDGDISRMSTHRRVALRLGRLFQITDVFPGLTVDESVILAAPVFNRIKLNFLRAIPSKEGICDQALKVLEAAGLLEQNMRLPKSSPAASSDSERSLSPWLSGPKS
jgi:ABC-type branched-subunit amino acid transport system ATPase component